MALVLTGSFEQALMALVIDEAGRVRNRPLGRTTLQKMLYFLLVYGVPMKYQFDIHHYGPYCDEVTRDAEWLCVDDVILDVATNPNCSDYRPGPQIDQILRIHKNAILPLQPKIRKVVTSLAPLEPNELELVSTIHYLYRQIRTVKTRGPWQRPVINSFMKVKRNRFKREKVLNAYKAMQRIGLIEA